ncbi:MAG TPA: EAL domain-containing protein [Methylibium sp.]|nr:EAL domain-containing protein [Methylibium sp.]
MNLHAVTVADEPPETARVLLVDDNEMTLTVTAAALEGRGFSVTMVTSGEEALARLRDWSPDIVVLDADMPGGISGFTTCAELRAQVVFEMLPVLMLTGLNDDESIRAAYAAGATDFFVKSEHWSLLAMRLRHMLRASRDVSALKRSESKLARAQELARMGSFEWWRDRRGLSFSPEALRVFGLAPDEPVTLLRVVWMVAHARRKEFIVRLRSTLNFRTVFTDDVSLQLHDGRQRTVRVEAEPIYDELGGLSGYTGIVQDVTERRVQEDKIRRLAEFDDLTDLPNRANLLKRAEKAVEQAQRLNHQVGVLLIDLDRFKEINDTLGHKAGDEVLRQVAVRLKGCVRHSDAMPQDESLRNEGSRAYRQLEGVGRLGGDEFVALLPEIDADPERAHEAIDEVARRILGKMREPVVVDGKDYFVTASVGVSLFPRDGASVVDLLSSADVAMYSVKDGGRNSYSVYRPELAGRGRERLELQSALHKAVERDELVLYYQPKLQFGDERDDERVRLVGVEALMRWRRNGVLVPPSEFIPLAEDTGLIVPMSEWLIREAARQAGVWRKRSGRPIEVSVAVNLPSLVFERNDVAEWIRSATEEHGVPHRTIEVEITERTLMKRLKDSPTLHKLNQYGVEIAIDDFGTDYSSLAALSELPISELKIDRSFVTGLGVTLTASAVANAILALASVLGMRVVAEGVETRLQIDRLRDLGCRTMQGFYFAAPLPAAEFETWHDARDFGVGRFVRSEWPGERRTVTAVNDPHRGSEPRAGSASTVG